MRPIAWILLVFAFSALAGRAAAGDDPWKSPAGDDANAEAEALFLRALADDDAQRYALALEEYERAIAKSPSSPHTPRAASRAQVLRAHEEGDFQPFAQLERVRRDPANSNSAAEIDALARDADGFPPGLVRVEARMLAGGAYLHRLGRRADGELLLRKVIEDPKVDPITLHQAARELVDALMQDGDLDGARGVVASLGAARDPKLVRDVTAALRRRAARRGAIAVLGLWGVLATAGLARAARRSEIGRAVAAVRRSAKLAIAYVAYVALGGGALAAGYEAGNAKPFLAFGAALLPLVLLARAWGAVGNPATLARASRAGLAAAAVVSAAFLVLESIDKAYLEGFGL